MTFNPWFTDILHSLMIEFDFNYGDFFIEIKIIKKHPNNSFLIYQKTGKYQNWDVHLYNF